MRKLIRIYLDTEFTGLHQYSTLISMALVAETGDEFYAEFDDYDKSQIGPWHEENVLPHLGLEKIDLAATGILKVVKGDSEDIRRQIVHWLNEVKDSCSHESDESVFFQFWSDVPAYDWVLFCNLFGSALDIPKDIHYMPMDVATLLYVKGQNIDQARIEMIGHGMNKNQFLAHHALWDARLIKKIVDQFL